MIHLDIPLGECLALGFDLGIYYLCRVILRRHVEILKEIREAPKFDSYPELQANLLAGGGGESRADDAKDLGESSGTPSTAEMTSIPYAVIQGRVEPVDAPISSQFVPLESGVIKTFSIKDHKVVRRHGLWHEKADKIQDSSRNVPFKIVLSKEALQSAGLLRTITKGVEFRDLDKLDNPLHGELDVIYDKFEPSSTGFGKALMDNFRGDLSKGIQETEKMLLVGTKVTAIGKVIMKGAENGVQMVYPSKEYEFILTKKTYEEVVQGYEEVTGIIRIITYVLGATGVFLAGLIAQRLYKEIVERRQYSALLRQLSEQRRVGNAHGGAADENAEAAQLGGAAPVAGAAAAFGGDEDAASPVAQCIVCMMNPRDVILLSCGHVCVCSGCAAMLPSNRCPMCRSQIERVQPFFIA